jgi:hypothetical protein
LRSRLKTSKRRESRQGGGFCFAKKCSATPCLVFGQHPASLIGTSCLARDATPCLHKEAASCLVLSNRLFASRLFKAT